MHFSDASMSDVCRTLGEDTSGTQNNEKKQEHLLNILIFADYLLL